MATQDLLGNDYAVFADVEAADIYLAASADLGEAWAALNATAKARAVISATRLLQTRVNWKDGVPSTDAPVAAVAEANSALAGAIAVNPETSSSPGTSSNIKRVGAGPAAVEFFKGSDDDVLPLPEPVFAILSSAGLLGGDDLLNVPFASGTDQKTRFDFGDV